MSAYKKHLSVTIRYGLFGFKWSEFCRGLLPAICLPALLEEKNTVSGRGIMKAGALITLMSQLEITHLYNWGQRGSVCVCVCVYPLMKMCVQPVRLQGVEALTIPYSTVEAEAAAIS